MPSTDGFPLASHSANIHASAAAAVANWVANIAMPGAPVRATAEPALKPNQPTQSIDAPDQRQRQVVRRHRLACRSRRACRGRARRRGRRCRR
jgi:hypothetical protein